MNIPRLGPPVFGVKRAKLGPLQGDEYEILTRTPVGGSRVMVYSGPVGQKERLLHAVILFTAKETQALNTLKVAANAEIDKTIPKDKVFYIPLTPDNFPHVMKGLKEGVFPPKDLPKGNPPEAALSKPEVLYITDDPQVRQRYIASVREAHEVAATPVLAAYRALRFRLMARALPEGPQKSLFQTLAQQNAAVSAQKK